MLSVLECDECLALEQDTLHANEDIYKNDWLGMLNIAFEELQRLPLSSILLWVHQFNYEPLICLSKINFSQWFENDSKSLIQIIFLWNKLWIFTQKPGKKRLFYVISKQHEPR